jgi:hypothetical protein
MQEHFNRLLEAIVEKKGVEYGDSFIKDAIAPNLHHFARIKLDMRCGVGLAQRSGKHHSPHQRPEVRNLLTSHREHELHRRRGGRVYQDINKDCYDRGVDKLAGGKLEQWSHETTILRNVLQSGIDKGATGPGDVESQLDEDAVDDEEISGPETQTMGFAEVVDGHLYINLIDKRHFVEETEDLFRREEEEESESDD